MYVFTRLFLLYPWRTFLKNELCATYFHVRTLPFLVKRKPKGCGLMTSSNRRWHRKSLSVMTTERNCREQILSTSMVDRSRRVRHRKNWDGLTQRSLCFSFPTSVLTCRYSRTWKRVSGQTSWARYWPPSQCQRETTSVSGNWHRKNSPHRTPTGSNTTRTPWNTVNTSRTRTQHTHNFITHV